VIELDGDVLIDSSYSGLHLFASRIADVRITRLSVDRPGTVGLAIQAMGAAKVAQSNVEGGVDVCLPFVLEVTGSQGLDTPKCRGI
jgi:hypothetical protein